MAVLSKISGIFLLIIFIVSCERNVEEVSESVEVSSEYVEDSSLYAWDEANATIIEFSQNTASISGAGAEFSASVLTIYNAGTYVISGALENGRVIVSAEDDSVVKLVLNEVDITSNDNACIFVDKAAKAVLIINDGTSNYLTDSYSYSSDEENAVVFSKTDLVIFGAGKLTVDANYNDGITSKDGLEIASGVFDITSVDDGIRGKDYIVINSGDYSISSGGDAIKSDNEEEDCGIITITTGIFDISAEGDGIVAQNNLNIVDGSFSISTSSAAYLESTKALKSGNYIKIQNGDFILSSDDDGIHADNSITINNGVFAIASGDDGIHGDEAVTVISGTITISESYEGIEGANITIGGGDIHITASDDGLNASDGSGTSTHIVIKSTSSAIELNINGGYIVLNAQGDAFDCNGSATMSDGDVIIHGPTASNNGSIDYDGSFIVSGGSIIGAGSSGMAQAPGSSSSQNSLLFDFNSTLGANTLVNVQNASGDDVITFAPLKSFASVVVCDPKLIEGETYYIYYGGSSSGTSTDGVYTGGVYTKGTLFDSFTLSSTVTEINVQSNGGPGGRP